MKPMKSNKQGIKCDGALILNNDGEKSKNDNILLKPIAAADEEKSQINKFC